jgi:hypothetical protein
VLAKPWISAVAKLCAQEGALTGAEDAQMSSRYRWLVTSPASHALLSAAEAPVCLQKRSTKACLTAASAERRALQYPDRDAAYARPDERR